MQMPGRVVEDATVQCVPVTRYHKVDKIFSTTDLMLTYNPSDGTSPRWFNSAGSTTVTYATQPGGYKATLSSTPGITTLDAYMTFRALPTDATGLIVDVTMSANDHPSITGLDRICVGQGTLEVELRNLASGGIGTYLTTVFITGGGTGRLTVPPNMVQAGDVIRMWQHYDAGPVSPYCVGLSYTSQAQITYTNVVSNVLKPVDQQYVTLSCDTDGNYAAGYRYGFNGQVKDEEIAGNGNILDFGARQYDARLARLNWKVDPKAERFPYQSPYLFGGNSPIQFIDKNGELKYPKGKEGADYAEAFPFITAYLAEYIKKDVEKSSALANEILEHANNPDFTKKVLMQEILTWNVNSRTTIRFDKGLLGNANTVNSRNITIGWAYAEAVEKILSNIDGTYSAEDKQAAITAFFITMMDEITLAGSKYQKNPLMSEGGSDGDVGNDLTDAVFYSKDGYPEVFRMNQADATQLNSDLNPTKEIIQNIQREKREDVIPTTPQKN